MGIGLRSALLCLVYLLFQKLCPAQQQGRVINKNEFHIGRAMSIFNGKGSSDWQGSILSKRKVPLVRKLRSRHFAYTRRGFDHFFRLFKEQQDTNGATRRSHPKKVAGNRVGDKVRADIELYEAASEGGKERQDLQGNPQALALDISLAKPVRQHSKKAPAQCMP